MQMCTRYVHVRLAMKTLWNGFQLSVVKPKLNQLYSSNYISYTNFGLNNKNPMGFKFSDPVFPCFWQLGDSIYVNL